MRSFKSLCLLISKLRKLVEMLTERLINVSAKTDSRITLDERMSGRCAVACLVRECF